jgi:uncharacterized protein (TIGR02145 family)
MGGNFKKIILISSSITISLSISAQDYLLTFKGKGQNTSVSSVIVQNITQGTEITINGNDILHLKGSVTGIAAGKPESAAGITFSPNPMSENSVMEFSLLNPEKATISVFDMSGREILRKDADLEGGRHAFRISGLKAGLYLIRVKAGQKVFNGKLISSSSSEGNCSIVYMNSESVYGKDPVSKGSSAEVIMPYSSGDRLKFTGIDGKHKTVIVATPESNRQIEFGFYACSDADGNNYPVVEIGQQVWMAENLRTTKYQDGTAIPNVTSNSSWSALDMNHDIGYCWYGNDLKYKDKYGALYNSWAVHGGPMMDKNVCPTGWHVPGEYEWYDLALYLDPGSILSVVSEIAGGSLKEAGTKSWENPNTGATNSTGFSALPGGRRSYDGTFTGMGKAGYWMSDKGLSFHTMVHNAPNLFFTEGGTEYGHSVRCIKDK